MKNPVFIGKHSDLTEKIIGVFYSVYNELGFGFTEKVYENALVAKLRQDGMKVEQQAPITVNYLGEIVGQYIADLVVEGEGMVLVEIKSVKALKDQHDAQLLNYLKATKTEVGLLFNFGSKAEFKRKIFDNSRKGSLSWTESNL
jgi:GxxExxY protein